MTVKDLIKALEGVDENLPIRVEFGEGANYWVNYLSVFNTGLSGYEIEGEVVLEVSE